MFIVGVLLFSLAVPLVSFLVSKPGSQDQGKVALSTALVAWGSMLVGLMLSKVHY